MMMLPLIRLRLLRPALALLPLIHLPLKDITYVHEKTSEATKYNLLSNSSKYSPNFKFYRCENGRSFQYQWLLNNNDSELKNGG